MDHRKRAFRLNQLGNGDCSYSLIYAAEREPRLIGGRHREVTVRQPEGFCEIGLSFLAMAITPENKSALVSLVAKAVICASRAFSLAGSAVALGGALAL